MFSLLFRWKMHNLLEYTCSANRCFTYVFYALVSNNTCLLNTCKSEIFLALVNYFFCSTGLIINFFHFVQTEIDFLLFFAKEMIRKYLNTIHCNKNLKISRLISYLIQWSSFLHDYCEILRDN